MQHPSEVKQSKGTVAILKQSFADIRCFVGEDFSHHAELNQLLVSDNVNAVLLYPSPNAIPLDEFSQSQHSIGNHPPTLVVLDGTWKKAFRMFQLSTNIQRLTAVKLNEAIEGRYTIRKTKKNNALSTLEACCYALSSLDREQSNYDKLLNKFDLFNQFQLSFVPDDITSKITRKI